MRKASKNGGCWLMNEQSMGNRSEIPRSLTCVRHDVCSSNWPAACGSAGVALLHHDSLNWSHRLTLAVPMICSWWSRNKYFSHCVSIKPMFSNFDCKVADKNGSSRQLGILGDWSSRYPRCHPCRLSNFVLRRPYCSEQDRLGDVFNTEVFARTGGMTEAGSIGLLTSFDCILWQHIPPENRRV